MNVHNPINPIAVGSDYATSCTEEAVLGLVNTVKSKPACRGVLSTGEAIAVALVLDRREWLAQDGYTILEAIDRLGAEWTRAAIRVQRNRIPDDWFKRKRKN
jgi:hypothetical protein